MAARELVGALEHRVGGKRRLHVVTGVVGLALLFLLWRGLGGRHKGPVTPPPRQVIVANVTTADVPLYIDEIGTTAPYETVEIKAQVTGQIISRPEPRRVTPYHPAHSTAVAGLVDIKGGDDRFYNNILVGKGESSAATGKAAEAVAGFGLWVYDTREFPLQTGGNVYCNGARPSSKEAKDVTLPGVDPKARIEDEGQVVYLRLAWERAMRNPNTALVTTELLGKAKIPGLAYENPDGSPLKIDTDYFGKRRNGAGPTAGPFENPGAGPLTLKVR